MGAGRAEDLIFASKGLTRDQLIAIVQQGLLSHGTDRAAETA